MKKTFNINIHNTQLFAQYWKPEKIKAVIIIVHGMGAHSGRYEHSVVPTLVKNNFGVMAFDLFGHGKSQGKRGHCPSYEALLDAIETIIVKTEELFPNKPKFLYGHSLGGNLCLNYVITRTHRLKGVVATSPFLRLAFQPPKWKMTLGKIMLKIAPSFTLPSEIETTAISSMESEVKRYEADVLIHGKISPMFLFPVIKAGEHNIKNADKITVPTLLFHGKADRIIDYRGSVDFNKHAKTNQLQLFENGFHELHHDIYKEEMLQSVVKWINNL